MSVGASSKVDDSYIHTVVDEAIAAMVGEMPGRIVSFNPVAQSASVQPLYRPIHDGVRVDAPVLLEVPVRFPRVGGFVITAPVNIGDLVTLRAQMRSGEQYHTGGEHEAINDFRRASMSDMEAFIDGGEPLTSPVQNFNDQNLEIRSESGDYRIEMTPSGRFKINGAQGDIVDILTQVVELLAADGLNITTGSSAGNNHALENQSQYATLAAKLRAMVI